ncbi:CheR family methyltransferase [Nakamurella deserti]|uniref:CheR family methyltransferase n=1 Tax=Nakamurella deserti TaxID=2164074 RepID=UPI000DBE73E0|nr:CheR family methyltransferase [Nakamurella deserti]
MNDTADALVDRVEELLRRRIGLRPESTLRGRLRRSLREEAAARAQTPEQFVDTVTARPEALQGLLDRVTVQETGFFRHPEHFTVLAETLLPTLPEPVSLWSAASSNGQEAYSLAMVLAENGIEGSVLATDLSTSAVQRTAAGRYTAREMGGLSPARIERHFTIVGDGFQVAPELRRRVSAHLHNLAGPLPDRARGCQVVFCRNVLIYFSPEHAATFVDRVADTLPGAALFLGGAEAMWPISRRYETVRGGNTFWYRLPAGAGRPTATVPTPPPPVPTPPPPVRARTAAAPGPTRPLPAAPPATPRTPPPPTPAAPAPTVADPSAALAADLTRAGQRALAAGDHAGAVVAFRKCVYLAPDDALAHLHLGLALEAADDRLAAQRSFGAARRALLHHDPAQPAPALGGYAAAELLRLLDTKRRG